MENFFCCSCNQVDVNPPLVSHVPAKTYFKKIVGRVRKNFYSCNFCDIYVKKEIRNSHEKTRDQFDNA